MKFFKYLIFFFIIIACDSLNTLSIYDRVEKNIDHYEAFEFKNIFTESISTGIWGKSNNCKEIYFDTSNNYIGKDHLHLIWSKTEDCKWLGFGFKWGDFKSKNLTPIINNTAIQFRIRSDSGEFFKVPMFFALVDYSEKQCFSKISYLGLEDGLVDESWRKVTIPLSTFKYKEKGVNISNIKELRIQLQNEGNFHVDDIKIVPHNHQYSFDSNINVKKINSFPVILGNEKKYWWGVDNKYSDNFSFITSSKFNDSISDLDFENLLPEFNVSLSLKVNYDEKNENKNWNIFGFPFSRWQFVDISNIYSSSALYFKVKANKLPKIQIFLSSYKGKIRRISKIIEKNNIHEINDRIYEFCIPLKSFKDFENLGWTSMKELRFKVLESNEFEIGNFKLIEFRGNPKKPIKWIKS